MIISRIIYAFFWPDMEKNEFFQEGVAFVVQYIGLAKYVNKGILKAKRR